MIDIHNHVIPNIDDGPRDLEESINLIKQGIEMGIHTIVATPHFNPYKYPRNRKDHILKYVEELNVAVHSEGLDSRVNILPGQEVYLYDGLIEGLDRGDILTINNNGKYLLVEFPMSFYPNYAYKIMGKLVDRHITPIIAHPERHVFFREDPNLLKKFTNLGAIIQINSSSLQNKKNKKVYKFSRSLLDWECAHVIASDAHNIEFRPFYATNIYKDKDINEYLYNYIQGNARSIIEGKAISQVTYNDFKNRENKLSIKGIFSKINVFSRSR
ncbi:tyrosine-protein phosphatase [Bacillus cereus]|uniref:tyrosine-protein phosphatase n=1 Tax=Bacillus cereus TaxID=1396 RepID=UPI000C282D4D|nr:CpsB/CapC family capsule biosynthesis tyrosine phosphatase [Bacillus cereus]